VKQPFSTRGTGVGCHWCTGCYVAGRVATHQADKCWKHLSAKPLARRDN